MRRGAVPSFSHSALKPFFRGKRVLLTAGPTREYLDPVRYLSNGSSGKMGLALAGALRSLGARVRLIAGPGIPADGAGRSERVLSAREMLRAVLRAFPSCDVFVSAAAVSDFRPARRSRAKLHRGARPLFLRLVPNPDILAAAGRRKRRQVCVGFALEDRDGRRRAFAKMRAKRCDLVLLNGPEAVGSDRVTASVLFPDGRVWDLGRKSKKECAYRLCQAIARIGRN